MAEKKFESGFYIHYKNRKIYYVIDTCKIQINDEWKDGVIYVGAENDEKYVRDMDDFIKKFKYIGKEIL